MCTLTDTYVLIYDMDFVCGGHVSVSQKICLGEYCTERYVSLSIYQLIFLDLLFYTLHNI